VNLARDTNIPADICMNTWHFISVGAATPSAAADAAAGQLVTFYQAIDANLAIYLNSAVGIDVYDLQDEEPRVPILSTGFTLTTGSGTAYPGEVAVCASYRGELASGTNPARRRGRIFIGPLDADTGTTLTGDCHVTDAFRTVLADACEALCGDGLTDDARWVVFSPTDAGPPPWSELTLNDSCVDVVAGYVDNSYDTIRSRGAKSTLRTTWSIVSP